LALRLIELAAWLIAASCWLTLAITLMTGDSLKSLPAQALAVIVLAATAWVAIRRYRLFDTRLAISRVLIYGSLSVCVIAVYLAVAASVEAVASDGVSAPVAVLAAVLVHFPFGTCWPGAANPWSQVDRLKFGRRGLTSRIPTTPTAETALICLKPFRR
jgi:two-component system, NarL family, sensor kinase